MTIITRAKGGTAERQVKAYNVTIPDLWHIAQRLPEPQRSEVLEAWHLAHDLLDHIQATDDNPPDGSETA